MPEAARLFIALPVDEAVRAAAARIISGLSRTGADYKWVEPQNLHLTLRFLGETPLERLPELGVLLETAARRPSFELVFSGLGAFSSWDDPKVVWLGVGRGTRELAELAAALGAEEEGRPFAAHLTLGRRRSRRGLGGLREAAAAGAPELRQKAGRIVLFESRLTPEGPVYSARQEASFSI
ncbi:MAG: RNA 2',3'-cyclic phosphodiesterase [Elusimicrobia bacterium]|nr:RNA 2',3'-cyclic phosphodiesterase [Elusimicrobiota bacterium]